MSYKKSKHPLVSLPRIPFSTNPALAKEEFWQQKEKSGAINAFRQLNSTWRRGGRKVTLLPGGKLKPLFKNDSHPENAALGSNSALPNIPGCGATTYAGFKQIISGSLENLPPLCPTTVKIYLCSNYEDMKHERIQLLKQAVPELQSYCSQLGLHFQLIDLHWGSSIDEHSWSAGGLSRQLHQNEISDCQRLSVGPHFVCLLGDRYGVQQLPSVLTESEYQIMTEISQEQSLSHSELLTKYYIKDENEIPTCYVFQKPEELSELNFLHKVVFEALNLLMSTNKLTEERYQELTMSALEEDVRHGILDTKDPRSHCLCYHREFRNINSDISQSMAEYVDTTVGETGVAKLDVRLKSRVMKLAEMAEEHLGVGNFHNYYLGWSENLEEAVEFKNYLKKMTEDFVKDVKEMITSGYNVVIKEISSKRSISSMVMQEALFHMQKCKSVVADCTRNKDIGLFSHLEAFLQDPLENSKPFIIWGRSGMGKTTTAAIIAQRLKTWFGEDCVVVLRFLGSTWQSASIHRTIMNITLQICLAYGINCPTEFESFNSLYQVLVTFRSVLDHVSKKFASSHPLFIVLDAIDQLHPFQESMKALWAMRDFPPNVHMILTTTDKLGEKDILSALTSTITVPAAVVEVPTLEEDEIRSYTEKFMMKCRRTLSEHQMAVFRMAVGKNPQPLYITQLMLKALRFCSNQEVSPHIPTTVEGLFAMQIERLEQEVGESIVQNFVAFLTASPVGVLESELLDLLTNNKAVMAEVYSLHHQPSDLVLLFPQKLLILMKHALQDFLCEHLLLGRVALAWTHREIYQAASNMYNIIYPGIAEVDIAEGATDFSLMIHEQFANMFLPESRTDLLSELPRQLVDNSGGWIVLNQPQMVHVENVQKLHRVLIHLSIMVPMEGLARIKQSVLFNFNWLYTKLQAAGLIAVMQDVVDVLLLAKGLAVEGVLEGEEEEDANGVWKDIDLLYHFLQLAMPSLSQNVNNLAVEILGRLLPLQMKYTRLRNLVEGAQEHLMTCQGPCIMPLYGCLPGPGGELRHTFFSATHVIDFREQSGLATTFSQQSGVRVWRLDSTHQIQNFSVNKEQAESGVLPGHAAPFIIIGHYSHLNHMMEIAVWSVDTGVAIINMTLPHRFEAIALSLDDQILFLATISQDVSKPNGNTLKRYILGIKVMTKEIIYKLPCADHHSDGVGRIIPVAGLQDGQNALITLGGFTSKDLICWDVDKARMDYYLEFEYFMDIFNINNEKNLGIGCSLEEGILVVIDLKDGAIIQMVQQATFQNMQDVYVSRSGDFIVVATAQDGIVIHSIPKNAQVKTIARKLESEDQMGGKPSKVTMDETEHFVFIGYHTGTIDIYSIVTGELLTVLTSHSKTINSLRVLPSDCLLSAADDNEAKLWHYGAAVSDHLSVHMMSGDAQFDSALEHKTKATNPTIQMDVSQTRMMCCLFLANNDETIVTGSFNGPIQLWETDSPEQPSAEITEKCEHGLTDLYLTYKDKLLVGHCINPDLPDIRTLQVWNFDSGQPIPFDKDVVVLVFTSCAFPSGDRILTISPSTDDRQKGIIVAIYDLFEMKCLASLQCNIYSSMDSTNLRLLGFTSVLEVDDMELESINENDVSLADVAQPTSNKLYAVLDYFPSDGLSFFFTFVIHGDGMKDISMDHHEPIHLDTISPDCNIVMPNNICISGTKDGSLVVWNVASQMVITNFCDVSHDRFLRSRQTASNLHVGPVTCLTATQDGMYIVSGGVDGKVKIWNLNNKTLVHTFSKHTERIIHVNVSSGNLITSASADNNIAVWDLQEKKYLCGFYVNDYITDVTITKDRKRLVGRVNEKHPSLLVLKLAGLEIAK